MKNFHKKSTIHKIQSANWLFHLANDLLPCLLKKTPPKGPVLFSFMGKSNVKCSAACPAEKIGVGNGQDCWIWMNGRKTSKSGAPSALKEVGPRAKGPTTSGNLWGQGGQTDLLYKADAPLGSLPDDYLCPFPPGMPANGAIGCFLSRKTHNNLIGPLCRATSGCFFFPCQGPGQNAKIDAGQSQKCYNFGHNKFGKGSF